MKKPILALGLLFLPLAETAFGQDNGMIEAAKKKGAVGWSTAQNIDTNGYSLQPTLAQSRMPMDRIVSGACVSSFQASQTASTMAS